MNHQHLIGDRDVVVVIVREPSRNGIKVELNSNATIREAHYESGFKYILISAYQSRRRMIPNR